MSGIRVEKEYPLRYEVDVLVAGGGLTGCCAAVAAAREGASVLLIEGTSALGGMATMGLVPGWCAFHDQQKFIHRGIAEMIRHALYRDKTAEPLESPKSLGPIDAEELKRVLDDLVTTSGAQLLFHTTLAEVIKDGRGGVDAVLIASKDGLSAVRAKVYVDCTGDGDLAAWAGATFDYGDAERDVQPVSHCFTISGVNSEAAWNPRTEGIHRTIIEDPRYDLIKDGFFGPGGTRIGEGTHVYNAGHLWDVDNTNPKSLTGALVNGRRMVKQYLDAFRFYEPAAFEKATLCATAPLLGVRETRRIHGDYTLVAADYWARRRFADEISLNCFFIDIHPSWKNRQREFAGEWSWEKEKNDAKYAPGEFHGIPYRCLTPKGVRNVLVAGRSVSADREVLSAIRVMPPCMTMGEAAGAAAVQALRTTSGDVHAIDINVLRANLIRHGAFLPPVPAQ